MRDPLRLAGLIALLAGVTAARGHAATLIARQSVAPGVEDIEFRSAALQRGRTFTWVTPPRMKTARLRPVLFLLHGRGRTNHSLTDVPALRALLLSAPFCTVLPQGDDGWYIDAPVEAGERYESYLTEVIDLATELGRFDPDPRQRAIAGWSMGGYGAVHYAVEHPGAFHIIGAVIGLLDFPRAADLPAGRNYTVPETRFGRDPAIWKVFNPLERVESLRGHAIFVLTADQAFDRVMNENFHARLEARSIPHAFVVVSGAHTFDVVQAALPKLVAFVSARLAE